MPVTRRHFVTTAAATAVTTGLPARVWSPASLTLGDTRIDTLSDGNVTHVVFSHGHPDHL